jgi:hypothetical protein
MAIGYDLDFEMAQRSPVELLVNFQGSICCQQGVVEIGAKDFGLVTSMAIDQFPSVITTRWSDEVHYEEHRVRP